MTEMRYARIRDQESTISKHIDYVDLQVKTLQKFDFVDSIEPSSAGTRNDVPQPQRQQIHRLS